MKQQALMHNYQLEKFAQFLEEHPGISPILFGENAVVCGFQIGKCILSLEDTERLLATPPDSRLAMLLAAPSPQRDRG